MARKSPWQEFAENFKGVYGTFKQIGQDVETSRIMDDERFMAEGGQGFGLKGNALEEARYKALGDIYTKYGNAKQGLEMRQGLANLEEKRRSNDLNEAILKNQINIQGTLAEQLAQGNVGLVNANTQNVISQSAARNKKLPYEVTGLANANRASELANQFSEQTNPNAIAALNTQNQSIVTRAPSADAAAVDQNILASQTARSNLSLEDLRTTAGAEAYKTQIAEAYAAQNTAQINELQTLGFLGYAERFSEGEFETPEQAKDAYLSVVAQFDPGKAMELAKKYSADEIGALANQGVKLQTEMNKILQKPGETALREAAEYFDKQNGEDTGVTFRKTDNGYEMFETADGENVGTVFENLSLEEAKSALQGLTTYGNATNYAEKLYARKVSEAGLKKTEAETQNIETKTEYQEILNDTTRYSTLLKNNNVEAQTELANAQVEKLKQDTEAEEGLDYSDKMAIKAFNNFLGGTTYADLAQNLDTAQLRVYTNRVKMGLGLLGQPPLVNGVPMDEDVWLAMSEADQALFN